MDDIDLEKVQYLLLMHDLRLTSKNLSHSSINVESMMPSSMHVNITAYTPRDAGKFMNNRNSFAQNRGGYVNREGRGQGRQSGRRICCQLCARALC